MRRYTSRLLLLAMGSVIALVIGELTVRIAAPQKLSGSWRVYDDRGYRINKAGGYAMHRYADREIRYHFTDNHLRATQPCEGGKRILVLGDSYTFGWLLQNEDTFVSRLQVYANQTFGDGVFCFLNGGAGGWGTAHYLAFLESHGDLLNVDVVLVFFNSDDIGRSVESGLYTLKDNVSLELQDHEFSVRPNKVKVLLNHVPGYQWLLQHSHVIQFLRRVYVNFHTRSVVEMDRKERVVVVPSSPIYGTTSKDMQRLGAGMFKRMKAWCDSRNVPLLVTTTGYHFKRNGSPDERRLEPTEEFRKVADDVFSGMGIPYKDISEGVQAEMGTNYAHYVIPDDYHPNEEGARLIAEKAWDWLNPLLSKEVE